MLLHITVAYNYLQLHAVVTAPPPTFARTVFELSRNPREGGMESFILKKEYS